MADQNIGHRAENISIIANIKRNELIREIQAMILDRNNDLIKMAKQTNINYTTLLRFRKNPNRLREAKWSTIDRLGSLADKYAIERSLSPSLSPADLPKKVDVFFGLCKDSLNKEQADYAELVMGLQLLHGAVNRDPVLASELIQRIQFKVGNDFYQKYQSKLERSEEHADGQN